jgi:hypothetical protein
MDIPRVKSNIQKMLDQGAPEADIDSYLSSEGVSLHDLKAQPEKKGFAERVFDNPPAFSLTGMAKDIYKTGRDFVTAPGEAYRGELDPSSDEAIKRMTGGAALATPAPTAMRAGERAIPGVARSMTPQKPVVPTAEALKEAAEAGYGQAAEMGVTVTAGSVKNLGGAIQAELEKSGVFAELAPKTFSILNKLQSPPEGAVATLANLETARKALGHAAGDFTNKTEQLAASRAIAGIDDFVTNVPAEGVVAGPAAAAGQVLKDARGDYAAAMRSNKITGDLDTAYTGVAERAGLNAAVANSGQNVANSIRQRTRDLLTRPKEARGYSEAELGQAERVARGTFPMNATRFTGNLLGGGGGLGAALTGTIGAAAGGAAAGNIPGAVIGATLPAIGFGLKKAEASLTKRELNKLDEMVRKRSPLFEALEKNPNMAVADPGRRMMLIRALLSSSQD